MEYEDIKEGDRVVIFNYTNTRPLYSGRVRATTKHFAEVKKEHSWDKPKWESRAYMQKVATPSPN